MSKWGDRFKEHYRGLDNRVIPVPEMRDENGKMLVIHARPASVRAAERIIQHMSKSPHGGYIEAMVLLAHDEKGEKLFGDDDRIELYDASKDMIEQIGMQIVRECTSIELSAPFRDIVKNSEAVRNGA